MTGIVIYMRHIQNKTLQDLEFPTVLQKVSDLCITALGKEKALEILPFSNEEECNQALKETSEYVSSFTNNNAIPSHYFEPLHLEIKYLRIEDSYLEVQSFKKIHQLVSTTNELLVFFKKFAEYYPTLLHRSSTLSPNKTILQIIDKVLDKYGEIKDNASLDLANIRKNMHIVRGKLNQSFGMALTQYHHLGYLDEIKETIVDNRRVLAVSAMYRRKVKGAALGQSKTGSIIYIEPESTLRFSRELSDLAYEECEEIMRILRGLTKAIRPFVEEIEQFQEFLTTLDITYGKSKYAERINGILPTIAEDRKVYFREAYHPILLENNNAKRKVTYPQTIELNESNRIIVISGPNASHFFLISILFNGL